MPPGSRGGASLAGRLAARLLRFFALVLAGVVAYFWSELSLLLLIRFDSSGLEPGEPELGLPLDYAATLFSCLGPVGWLVALGVFGLAFLMACILRRWPWPLRVAVVLVPLGLVIWQIVYISDLHSWVRSVCLQIIAAQTVPAVLAAVLCLPVAGRLARWGAQR